ncbi:MAG: hypothetical protein D6772_13475 [Bacteroidetes bacterium]|nr:MAG: hypothetical protein D6772_13475 [Bacteroidota bacterium]
MQKIGILLILLIGLVSSLYHRLPAQDTPFTAEQLRELEALEDTLGLLAYAIVNDSIKENRFFAVQAFIPKLVKGLKTPNSFQYPFEQLRTVSILYPPDSTFRIFTIHLYVDKDTYRYYGAIQMNTPELELYPLIDRSYELPDGDLEQLVLPNDKWYGAVYYNLYAVTHAAQPYYLLFGFDGYEFFRKRKVVDVLTFVNGKPRFGAPVFRTRREGQPPYSKNRLVLQYSAEASIRCNYDPALDLLIFDHLQEVMGHYGEGPTAIPDGTYEGYRLAEDGFWYYVEKVFNTVLDEPPVPEPILDKRAKDIMGRRG